MSSSGALVDSLIKEYLIFRGFSGTLKNFEVDLKVEKEKGFKVDRIVDRLCSLISSYELKTLHDLWETLNERVFVQLSSSQSEHVDRLENDLYKLYLANCYQNNKTDKIEDFFELLGSRLYQTDGWSDWFALPYLPNPQEQATFKQYFSKQWQEIYLISLHNFLSLSFHQMDLPTLMAYVAEQKYKQEPTHGQTYISKAQVSNSLLKMQAPPPDVVASAEIMDDFSIIAQAPTTPYGQSHSSSGISLKSKIKRKFQKSDKDFASAD